MELQYEKDSKERIPYEHYMELFQKADPAEIVQEQGFLTTNNHRPLIFICWVLLIRYIFRIMW